MPTPTTVEQTRGSRVVRFLNKCGALLEKRGFKWGLWSPTQLIEVAKHRCDTDDFGGGEFFEPLSRLLESCQREARLNLAGKLALRADVVRTLSNRLLMQRDRQLLPEILNQQINQPVFILGLPRSGTTLLHTLLAADPDHRAPLCWEVMWPSPPGENRERERIRRASRSLASLLWLAPTFDHVHAIGAELPQECVSLMTPSFLSDQFDTMYNVPSYRSWFLEQDLQPAYEFHRRFLQHLQQRKKALRWILKAPTHLFALPALLSIYPDARFVQTHRDPTEAIASVSSLITILRRIFSDVVDPRKVAREAWRYWAEAMAKFLRDRDRSLPSERICDVKYADIRHDPMDAVRYIYTYFGWPFSTAAEQCIEKSLRSQPREQNGFHRYRPSQFKLDMMDREQDFGAYCARFGLSPLRRSVVSGLSLDWPKPEANALSINRGNQAMPFGSKAAS
jgi:Sulfotransferase family